MKNLRPITLALILLLLPFSVYSQTKATSVNVRAKPVPVSIPKLTVDSHYMSGTTTTRTVYFPVGYRNLNGTSPLVAKGGSVSAGTVTTVNGKQQVTVTLTPSHSTSNGDTNISMQLYDPVTTSFVDFHTLYAYNFTYPPSFRQIHTSKLWNVFDSGPITFTFDNSDHLITSYEVWNYQGKVVDSGTVTTGSLTSRVTDPGFYKLWIKRTDPIYPYGDVVASTDFGIPAPLPAGVNFQPAPIDQFSTVGDGRYEEYESVTAWVQGCGPERIFIADATSSDTVTNNVKDILTFEENAYSKGPNGQVTDPYRLREHYVNFPNYDGSDAQKAGVTQKVAAIATLGFKVNFAGKNEPNGTPNSGWVSFQKGFYDAVKAGDPNASVVGPEGVDAWSNQDSFLANGGGGTFDKYSWHAYNSFNGDYDMGENTMTTLEAKLSQYGQNTKEKWQTEQGNSPNYGGIGNFASDTSNELVQLMVTERHGIPFQRQPYWYVNATGFWSFPNWLLNFYKTLGINGYLLRQWAVETYSKPFTSAYDFGVGGNQIWYGNRFDGQGAFAGKSMSAFSAKGSVGEVLRLRLSGTGIPVSITTHDLFGKTTIVPVLNNTITLPPSDLNIRYVETPSSVLLTPDNLDYGPDLALASGVKVYTPTNDTIASRLINGHSENGYNTSLITWTSDTGYQFKPGQAGGSMFKDTVFPYDIVIDLQTNQTVGRLVIQAPPMWQNLCDILDADVLTATDLSVTSSPLVDNHQITGTPYGDPGGDEPGHPASLAFDNNTSTYYQSTTLHGYVGIDAGTPTAVNKIEYVTRNGWEAQMSGGVFEGSNTSNTSGFVTIAHVQDLPINSGVATVLVSDKTKYRWLRYRDNSTSTYSHTMVGDIRFLTGYKPVTFNTTRNWKFKKKITQLPNTVYKFTDQSSYAVEAYDLLPRQHIWNISFKPTTARYVYLRINKVTQGGAADETAQMIGGQPGNPQVTIGELGVYAK